MTDSLLLRLRKRVRPRRTLRRLLRRMDRRRAGLPRVLVNGWPRSGTHLLRRCVSLLPGLAWDGLWVPPGIDRGLATLDMPAESASTEPRPQVLVEFDRVLSSLSPGEYVMTHLRYHPAAVRLIEQRGFRALLILRDLRDLAVSLAFFIVSHPEHRQHDYFSRTLRSDDERLLACIVGTDPPPGSSVPRMVNIGTRFQDFRPWMCVPLNYTTRFERLVGPQGGGSLEVQCREIETIARHLRLSLAPAQVESVAAQLFGQGSSTFRRGQIGSWKEHFNEEQKAAFKRVAGRELIELGYEPSLDW